MAKPIAPSVVQSESKIAGLLDQLKAVIRRSGLSNDQLQAIRDSSLLTVEFEPLLHRLSAVVCNFIRVAIGPVKEFSRPDWMRSLVRGHETVAPGVYMYTFEPFHLVGEVTVKGAEMVRRAKFSGACSGLQHALYILENQHLMPEYLQGKYLVFAGTEALDSDGTLHVLYLDSDDDRWALDWIWIGHGFCRNDLLVRACKL